MNQTHPSEATALVCGFKVRYATRGMAVRVHQHLMKRRSRRKGGLDVYRCPNCDGYHLGRPKSFG